MADLEAVTLCTSRVSVNMLLIGTDVLIYDNSDGRGSVVQRDKPSSSGFV